MPVVHPMPRRRRAAEEPRRQSRAKSTSASPWPRRAGVILGLAAVGLLIGAFAIPLRFSAEARLVVGQQTIAAQSVPGYAVATQQLAATYSRFVVGDQVQAAVGAVARGATVDASPIPGSSVIRVEAQAGSSTDAVAAANAAAAKLVELTKALPTDAAAGSSAQAAYLAAQQGLTDAKSAQTAAQRALDAAIATNSGDQSKLQAAVDDASADVSLAELRVQGAASAYQAQIQAGISTSASVEFVQKAAALGSDRSRVAVLGAFIGACLAAVGLAANSILRQRRSR